MKRSRMTGADAVAANLKRLPQGMGPAYNQASRKALKPQLDAAKANLKAGGSDGSGGLRKALRIRRDPKSPPNRPVHYVGPTKAYPGYRVGHLLEFGVTPHLIGGWMHPGHTPRPFLTPAFEQTQQLVFEILGQEIGPAIERRAAVLAARQAKKG